MSKLFAIVAVLVMAGGCEHAAPKKVEDAADHFIIFHDDVRGVTCWHCGNGVACLPDSQLTQRAEAK